MKKKSQQNSQIWYMLLWFGGITILTVIDQLTKHLAVKYLKETSGIILIPDVLEFQYVENPRHGFWIASGAPDPVFNPLRCLLRRNSLFICQNS